MFRADVFDEKMKRSGLKKRFIAKQLGIAYDSFLKKTAGTVAWKVDEAKKVSEILHLNRFERDNIFFG